MSRLLAKLDFIHRRLWRDDGLYRIALLFGPAPLLGFMFASAVWGIRLNFERMTSRPPNWATPHAPEVWNSAGGQAITVQPDKPLPATDAAGGLIGYGAGWRVTANPIQVSDTLDVDVKPTSVSTFSLDGPNIDMDRIIAGGPKNSLFVGVGLGYLAIRVPGVYSLSARIDRSATNPANCLTRFGLGPRRIVSNLEVAITGDVSKTFAVAQFDLQPGLYTVGWAFGCWHDQEMTGPGRMTILIGHPGEPTPLPARADDIVRPERAGQR
jgi:hypothetical protein